MKSVFIFKTGQSFDETVQRCGDFEDWIKQALTTEHRLLTIDVLNGEPLPALDDCLAVIITGSHAMVTDRLDWSVALEQWLQVARQRNIAVLGICYGHQLLAQAFGGEVDFHPQGIELGTVAIQLNRQNAEQDALFATMPDEFFGQVTHSQSVRRLPPEAVNLAGNAFEVNQAFRIGACIWGVQFHPEFSVQVMPDYITQQTAAIERAGLSRAGLLANLRATPEATALLRRFVEFAAHQTSESH
ncbi:GMP synthase [Thiosulfatimonas sediminis]|uniref:GMP synthase n=1 Tax=Thiosulfatimonas sediminis TaxID=2675054 RepID=A0A6F8PVQ8_9GAMM|nr:glutamine amidotransferase [Thiosulfatimonas sediminis]BBP46088.1 GMP synthase [Thiosulfatimonas sediminis]